MEKYLEVKAFQGYQKLKQSEPHIMIVSLNSKISKNLNLRFYKLYQAILT